MERAIDGGTLRDNLTDIYGDGNRLVYLKDVLDLIDEQPTITPPNEPLTLEQLREMDGEPVWVVEYPDWGHWELSAHAEDYLAEREEAFYGMKHDDPAGRYGLHKLGWLAYRRPLEGEEDT